MSQQALSSPITGPRRLARGWFAAGIATLFAALSHQWAAPISIEPALILLTLAFAAPVTVLLTKHKFTPRLTAVSVLISQGLFHTIFMAAPHGAHATLEEAVHCGPITVLGESAGSSTSIIDMALAHASWPMLAAHMIAAAGTIALLSYGEQLLGAVTSLVKGLSTAALLEWVQPAPRPRLSGFTGHTLFTSPRLRELAATLSYRGPPAISFIR